MTKTLKANNQNDWMKIRSQGLGGSDAAAVMGFSPWRTPVDVWLEKTGQKLEVEKSNALIIGTMLENVVAELYTRETGRKVQKFNQTITDGECLLGNIDRLIVPDGEKVASWKNEIRTTRILECKTSSDYAWEDVPVYYLAQVQHYMGLVPEVETCDVAVIFKPTNGFKVFRVDRSPEDIEAMQSYLRYWWKRFVETKTSPDPESESDCRKLWARSRGIPISATCEILESVLRLKEIRESVAQLKQDEESVKTTIACFMKDADTLLDPESGSSVLTYKTSRDRESTDLEAVIEELQKKAGVTDSELDELKKRFTTSKPGTRPFAFPKSKK